MAEAKERPTIPINTRVRHVPRCMYVFGDACGTVTEVFQTTTVPIVRVRWDSGRFSQVAISTLEVIAADEPTPQQQE